MDITHAMRGSEEPALRISLEGHETRAFARANYLWQSVSLQFTVPTGPTGAKIGCKVIAAMATIKRPRAQRGGRKIFEQVYIKRGI